MAILAPSVQVRLCYSYRPISMIDPPQSGYSISPCAMIALLYTRLLAKEDLCVCRNV